MLSADIKSKIDKLWNTFWSGGISNPLTVIEQISYLGQVPRSPGGRAKSHGRSAPQAGQDQPEERHLPPHGGGTTWRVARVDPAGVRRYRHHRGRRDARRFRGCWRA